RYPIYSGFNADISTSITKLRGMEQLMIDMYESPQELHSLLAFFEKFGLVHYGCCEDLGEKIGMLRQLKNLRSIAVTPVANVRHCA
ncbi:MAG: hypothetical protein GX230_04610, partial [Lentisphaerae bacterium]|nr:hypothetical protein [Lentisphaerota bacterium]